MHTAPHRKVGNGSQIRKLRLSPLITKHQVVSPCSIVSFIMGPKPKAGSPRKNCEAIFTREIVETRDFPETSRVIDAQNEMANQLKDRLSRGGQVEDPRQWQSMRIPPGNV